MTETIKESVNQKKDKKSVSDVLERFRIHENRAKNRYPAFLSHNFSVCYLMQLFFQLQFSDKDALDVTPVVQNKNKNPVNLIEESEFDLPGHNKRYHIVL